MVSMKDYDYDKQISKLEYDAWEVRNDAKNHQVDSHFQFLYVCLIPEQWRHP